MATTRHTPGPWAATTNADGGFDLGPLDDEHGGITHSILEGAMVCEDDAENAANAALIVAAPDLLDALNETLMAFEAFMREADWGRSSLSADTIRRANEAPGRAKAALRKAKGME